MRRKRPETNRSGIAKMLIEGYGCKNTEDIQDTLKKFLGDTLESILHAELNDHLSHKQ